jgi:hypothetical protein
MCDGRLQYRACEARAHLASHTDNRVEIEAVGGIECIARAMRSHPTDSELQFSAYRALAKLARHAEQPGQDGGSRRNRVHCHFHAQPSYRRQVTTQRILGK